MAEQLNTAAEPAAGTPENPCCPFDVLDDSYRQLNRFCRWVVMCLTAIATHVGCTLPPRPNTDGRVMTTKSAGWGNGTKA
jgi:hypothetical protein